MSAERNFNDVMSKLLTERLKKYGESKDSLNLVTCTQIYKTIFETLAEVFQNAKLPLTNESVNFVAQLYYDGILINGKEELDPNIFTQRAKLENIETKEIALLATMLQGTDFVFPFIQEIKRRS